MAIRRSCKFIWTSCARGHERLVFFVSTTQPLVSFSYSINEYEGRDIPCSGDVSVSVGSGVECPQPGEEVIAGMGIYGVTGSFWFNVGMVVVLQVVFRFGAYILLRRSR